MDNEIFQALGLSEREVAIYKSLLRLGPSAIRTVATHAGFNRGTTYETLKDLQTKGVVTYLPKGARRVFAARDPDVLLSLAQEQKQKVDTAIESLKSRVIPELHHLKPDFNTANVQFYEGDAGIEWVLKDILSIVSQSTDKNYCVFSAKPIRPYLYRPFPNFTNQRIQKNIGVRVIAIGDGGEDAPLSERKWIKTEGAVDAAYIAIYPPRCAIISLASENYPTAVVIDSKEVAAAQKIVFDTLWQLL
ncbi:MAG: TrmB family transcriptional regulator [Pontibacterium sp.]